MDVAFEQTLINRLRSLNDTQRSIEKTSQHFMKHRHLAPNLVKLWFAEFHTAPAEQKLAFIYLANDILMKSLDLAPQFIQLFEPVLPLAFGETAKLQSHQIRSALARNLVLWGESKIYPRQFLRRLRSECQRAAAQADTENPAGVTGEPSPFDFSFTAALLKPSSRSDNSFDAPATPISASSTMKFFSPTSSRGEDALFSPASGRFQEDLLHDPLINIRPPETSELIEQLEAIQNSPPSRCEETRLKISRFPVELSQPEAAANMLAQGMDREVLIQRAQAALHQMEVYNARLDEEMKHRQNLILSLRAYKQALRESCQNIRSHIQEVGEKRAFIGTLQSSLDNHIHNLPDEQKLQEEFLSPLPSFGDLFS